MQSYGHVVVSVFCKQYKRMVLQMLSMCIIYSYIKVCRHIGKTLMTPTTASPEATGRRRYLTELIKGGQRVSHVEVACMRVYESHSEIDFTNIQLTMILICYSTRRNGQHLRTLFVSFARDRKSARVDLGNKEYRKALKCVYLTLLYPG